MLDTEDSAPASRSVGQTDPFREGEQRLPEAANLQRERERGCDLKGGARMNLTGRVVSDLLLVLLAVSTGQPGAYWLSSEEMWWLLGNAPDF